MGKLLFLLYCFLEDAGLCMLTFMVLKDLVEGCCCAWIRRLDFKLVDMVSGVLLLMFGFV